MPPKTKVTRNDIVEAGLYLVRQGGEKSLNARDIAARLGCSTQPIFTNFDTMDSLREAVLEKAGELFNSCLDEERAREDGSSYKAMGLGYIRFAAEEKELFKLMYMRDRSQDKNNADDTESVKKSVELIMKSTGLGMEKAFMLHLEMWIFVHGIASMVATSYLNWEKGLVSKMLTDAYEGIKARFVTDGAG